MKTTWAKTRRFPHRICWTGADDNRRTYALRITEASGQITFALRRTDRDAPLMYRRDGWKHAEPMHMCPLDGFQSAALEWADAICSTFA